AVGKLTEVVERHEVGMAQALREARFGPEAGGQPRVARQLRSHHLEGARRAEAQMERPVDRPHAPGPQALHDLVLAVEDGPDAGIAEGVAHRPAPWDGCSAPPMPHRPWQSRDG